MIENKVLESNIGEAAVDVDHDSAGLANGQLWANAQGPRNQGPAVAKFTKKI
jgi:hypothetical protein